MPSEDLYQDLYQWPMVRLGALGNEMVYAMPEKGSAQGQPKVATNCNTPVSVALILSDYNRRDDVINVTHPRNFVSEKMQELIC